MSNPSNLRLDALVGRALVAALALSVGGGVAEAAPSSTECAEARESVTERQQELTETLAAYRKQTSVAATAPADPSRDPDQPPTGPGN